MAGIEVAIGTAGKAPEPESSVVERLVSLLHETSRLSNQLVIPDSPFGEAFYSRLLNPVIGDYVIEVSRFGQDYTDGSVGTFLGMLLDENHPDGEDQDKCNYLWEIRAIDTGRIHRWGNARFKALPTQKIINEVYASLQ